MKQALREAKFLIVDDDKISVMAMQRAMRKLKIANETHVCSDGQHAWEFLKSEVSASAGLPPYIVTLDLNMPRMGGLEFLQAVRSDPSLSRVVVFVFTTSDTPQDVQSAYQHNVAGYVVKENPSETLARALDMLDTYSRIIELPL
ncbi:MAG: CheY-like chemotaxis protein [Sulfitobacter sp.]|jgi:CheY-like chemotaxis protein